MHAVPDGRHDDYDFRAALLRQLFAGRRADGRAGDRAGRCEPVLGKLVDKFGQRQVSIPTIIVWMIAATGTGSSHHRPSQPSWILFCIVPFMAAIPRGAR